MIPGLSAQFIEKGKEKEGQAKIKRYMTIMDSMTEKGELTQDFLFSNQVGHVSQNLFDSCCVPIELDNTNLKLMKSRGSTVSLEDLADLSRKWWTCWRSTSELPKCGANCRSRTSRDR